MKLLMLFKKVPLYLYLIIIIGISISIFLIYLFVKNRSQDVNDNLSQLLTVSEPQPEEKEVIWQEDVLVQEVPDHASKTRLSLPVPLDTILLGPQYHFQGFGAHIGDRSEGVEVVALSIKPGTLIRNLADGKVVQVIEGNEYMGCQVQIEYADGLSGRHHYLKECLVEKGDEIKEGHLLGEGNSTGNMPPSIEFLLADRKRTDGAKSEFDQGIAVSMFDYLNKEDQEAFIDRFKEEIIEPYIAQGQNAGEVTLWEPFLTNKILIHKD